MRNIVRRLDLPTAMIAISSVALLGLIIFMALALFSLVGRGEIGDAIIMGGCIIMSVVMSYYLIKTVVDNLKH